MPFRAPPVSVVEPSRPWVPSFVLNVSPPHAGMTTLATVVENTIEGTNFRGLGFKVRAAFLR